MQITVQISDLKHNKELQDGAALEDPTWSGMNQTFAQGRETDRINYGLVQLVKFLL